MPHTPTLVERVQTAIELARGVEAQQDGAVSSFDLATVAVAEMRGRPASLEEMRHRIELTLDELTGAVLNDPKFVKIAAAIEDLTAAWVRLGGGPPAAAAAPPNTALAALGHRAAARR